MPLDALDVKALSADGLLPNVWPSLLASGFASPWLLYGLLLAAIPIVIHLLHRRQFQETRWAAMRFLLAATRRNARKIRLEQFVLLAVRVLILLLVPLALARPYLETWSAPIQPNQPAHWILVLDASYSMGAQGPQGPNFQRAITLARQIVETAGQGDAFHLVRIGGTGPRVVVRQPAFRKELVLQELDLLEVTQTPGEVAPCLQDVQTLLEQVPTISRKEVCLISDFQANSWLPAEVPRRDEIRRQLRTLAERAHLTVLDLGLERTMNATVSDVSHDARYVLTNTPVQIRSRVANTGQTPLQRAPVSLLLNARQVQTRTVTLGPGESTVVDFETSFLAPGVQRLAVQVPEDSLQIDNAAYLAVHASNDIRVLLVEGHQTARDAEAASFYVRRALDPALGNQDATLRTTVVPDGQLLEYDMPLYDCVILCDVELLTRPEAEALRRYAEHGGGVLFILGANVSSLAYNELLYQDGAGLLPARIAGRVGSAADPQRLFRFEPGGFEHPILDAFRGNPGSGLQRPLILEYYRVEPAATAETVLSYDSGDPAIVEKPIGNGRCLLISTALDSSQWNTLPRRDGGVLVALLHEMLGYAVAGQSALPGLLVGDPYTRRLPRTTVDLEASVRRPDGTTAAVPISRTGDTAGIVLDDIAQSGFYELEIGPPLSEQQTFAVNVNVAESQLQPLRAELIENDLLSGLRYRYLTNWERIGAGSEQEFIDRMGLTRWLLYAALVLLCIELLLGWRFDYGLLLLYVIVSATLAAQTFPLNLTWGLLISILSLTGLLAILYAISRKRGRSSFWST